MQNGGRGGVDGCELRWMGADKGSVWRRSRGT